MEKLIKKLSDMRGISGFEFRINEEIKKMFEPFCDSVKIDALGNIIAVKKCGKENAKKVLLEAHADEIGLMVSGIDERGFLSIVCVGGVDARILPASEVIVHAKEDIKGVIGAKPPHLQGKDEAKKNSKIKDMAIDTGLPCEQVKKLVKVGDSVTFSQGSLGLLSGQFSGKSLDDRASVAALLTVLKNIKKEDLSADIYCVIAVKEEVGGFGAQVVAYDIMPDIAIAIDVCHAITPDNSDSAFEVGSGAIITCGPNIHPKLFDRLIKTAKAHKIKTDIEVEGGNTGTDAWVMQVVGAGIPTALLSIPLKYMHTSVETLKISDVDETQKLLTAFIKELDDMEGWLCL